MLARGWLWPARHVFAWFFAATAIPAAALFWLCWHSLSQDRRLEAQRIRERRDQAADLIVTALQQELAADRQRLPTWSPGPPGDSLVLDFSLGDLRTRPVNALLYYPELPRMKDLPAAVFSQGEDLEFRRQDYAAAVAAFEELTHSKDPRTRAGAHLRIARNLRKNGQAEAALREYSELAKGGPVPLDGGLNGIPADLVAGRARYALLLELGRTSEGRREADSLARGLDAGRWHLDQTTWFHYSAEIGHRPPASGLALAQAVEWVWNKRGTASSGQQQLETGGTSFTVLWTGGLALIAGPRYLQRGWIDPLASLLKGQHVRLALVPAQSGHGSFRAASATGLPWNLEVSGDDNDGDPAQFAASQRFLLAGAGLLAALLCTGSYWITRAARRELAVARLQSDFVAAVSHEFRTPLTLLRQTTEAFLEDRPVAVDQQRGYFEAQARATNRLRRLVESLLDLGRMEAGAKPYRLQTLDAAHFTNEIASEFQRETPDCRVQVISPPGPFPVEADPDALGNALWNLLDNAVKYSPASRAVRIEVAHLGSDIAIGVSDRGIGIPPGEQKAVFGKFFRGAAAQSNGFRGAGIGLSIVAHIVEAHRGRIRLESAPGAGSTFTILLPAGRS